MNYVICLWLCVFIASYIRHTNNLASLVARRNSKCLICIAQLSLLLNIIFLVHITILSGHLATGNDSFRIMPTTWRVSIWCSFGPLQKQYRMPAEQN